MSFEEAKDIIDELLSHNDGKTPLSLWLFGGEPTLVPELTVEIIHYINETTSIRKTFLGVVMFTNGLLWSQDIIDEMLKSSGYTSYNIQISYDGDSNSARDRGNLALRTATEQNMLKYIDSGLKATIRSTITPESYVPGTLYNLLQLSHQIGISFAANFLSEAFSYSPEVVEAIKQDHERCAEQILEWYRADDLGEYVFYSFDPRIFYNDSEKGCSVTQGNAVSFLPGDPTEYVCNYAASHPEAEFRVKSECATCDVPGCNLCGLQESVEGPLDESFCDFKKMIYRDVLLKFRDDLIKEGLAFIPKEDDLFVIRMLESTFAFLYPLRPEHMGTFMPNLPPPHHFRSLSEYLRHTAFVLLDLAQSILNREGLLRELGVDIQTKDDVYSYLTYLVGQVISFKYATPDAKFIKLDTFDAITLMFMLLEATKPLETVKSNAA